MRSCCSLGATVQPPGCANQLHVQRGNHRLQGGVLLWGVDPGETWILHISVTRKNLPTILERSGSAVDSRLCNRCRINVLLAKYHYNVSRFSLKRNISHN